MKNYDVVIIEPVYYSRKQVKAIQQVGTKVYGYINAMEADRWNEALYTQMEEKDFFHRRGSRVYYKQWDSYLMNIDEEHYRQVLLSEVTKQIYAKGCDGVFLDTVGNIDDEHENESEILRTQRAAMAVFMQSIKEKHPHLAIIQNWGFDTLSAVTYPFVNAIMWEGFEYSEIAGDEWAQQKIAKLKKLRKKHKIQVLTVSEREEEESRKYAESKGFCHFHSPRGYNVWE
ncbi:endo alpha-1,4 polygalactosaminidase [Marinococcus luteus]|uniref:endo alpha-1,4 polygalactosaminidase n=1 Tax=Marinococcus luteus TaxID=1122204 RepID=UPI002ACCE7FB|nr:endo alpha-1,4 polygalactosaminidase [Marinococcus luteus]MDZ5783354.1 endo alpha-1,4 polygalactosaminidase [Marinococcus luteus]